MCAAGFFFGWILPKFFKADRGERVSLMYALGMNNNGSALDIAATAGFVIRDELPVPGCWRLFEVYL